MALGACRECKREVSSEAKACPHCGAANPVASSSPSGCTLGCLALFIIAIASYASSTCDGGDTWNGSTPSATHPSVEHPSSGSARLSTSGPIVWRSKEAFEEGVKLSVNGAGRTHPEWATELEPGTPWSIVSVREEPPYPSAGAG